MAPKRPNDLVQLIQKALPVYGGRCFVSIATACLPKVIDEKHRGRKKDDCRLAFLFPFISYVR